MKSMSNSRQHACELHSARRPGRSVRPKNASFESSPPRHVEADHVAVAAFLLRMQHLMTQEVARIRSGRRLLFPAGAPASHRPPRVPAGESCERGATSLLRRSSHEVATAAGAIAPSEIPRQSLFARDSPHVSRPFYRKGSYTLRSKAGQVRDALSSWRGKHPTNAARVASHVQKSSTRAGIVLAKSPEIRTMIFSCGTDNGVDIGVALVSSEKESGDRPPKQPCLVAAQWRVRSKILVTRVVLFPWRATCRGSAPARLSAWRSPVTLVRRTSGGQEEG